MGWGGDNFKVPKLPNNENSCLGSESLPKLLASFLKAKRGRCLWHVIKVIIRPLQVSRKKHQANSALQTPRLKRRTEQLEGDDRKPQVQGRFHRHLPLPMPDIANGSQHSCSVNLAYKSLLQAATTNWSELRKSCLLSEFRCSVFKLCGVCHIETS